MMTAPSSIARRLRLGSHFLFQPSRSVHFKVIRPSQAAAAGCAKYTSKYIVEIDSQSAPSTHHHADRHVHTIQLPFGRTMGNIGHGAETLHSDCPPMIRVVIIPPRIIHRLSLNRRALHLSALLFTSTREVAFLILIKP